MKKTILYCTADNHLDARTNAAMRETSVDPMVAFTELVDIVINDEVDGDEKVLILAGDVTDRSKVSLDCIDCLSRALSLLSSNNIEVIAIAGNHDMVPAIAAEEFSVTMLKDGEEILRGEWTIVGINGNISAVSMKDILDETRADLVVMHTAFKEYLGFEGAYKFSLDDVDHERVKNILVGDIHTAEAVEMENGFMLSPGSTFATNITTRRPFYVWRWEYGLAPEKIQLKSSRGISVHEVVSEDTMKMFEFNLRSIAKEVNHFGLKPYVRVSFIPEFSDAIAALEGEYAGLVLFHSINSPSLSLGVGRLSDGATNLDIGEVTLLRALADSKDEIDADVYDVLAELLKHDSNGHDYEILVASYKSFSKKCLANPDLLKPSRNINIIDKPEVNVKTSSQPEVVTSSDLPDLPALPGF